MEEKYKVRFYIDGMTPILSKDYWSIYEFNEIVLPRLLKFTQAVQYEFVKDENPPKKEKGINLRGNL